MSYRWYASSDTHLPDLGVVCKSTPFRGNIVMVMVTMPIPLRTIGLRVGSTVRLFFLVLFAAGKVNFFFHPPAEQDVTRSFVGKSRTITTNLFSLTFAFSNLYLLHCSIFLLFYLFYLPYFCPTLSPSFCFS